MAVMALRRKLQSSTAVCRGGGATCGLPPRLMSCARVMVAIRELLLFCQWLPENLASVSSCVSRYGAEPTFIFKSMSTFATATWKCHVLGVDVHSNLVYAFRCTKNV